MTLRQGQGLFTKKISALSMTQFHHNRQPGRKKLRQQHHRVTLTAPLPQILFYCFPVSAGVAFSSSPVPSSPQQPSGAAMFALPCSCLPCHRPFASLSQIAKMLFNDVMELCIHFFKSPAVTDGILAHFQAGGCYAACVGCLSGAVEHLVSEVHLDSSGGEGMFAPSETQ